MIIQRGVRLLATVMLLAPALSHAGTTIRFIEPGATSQSVVVLDAPARAPHATSRLRAWPPVIPNWASVTALNVEAFAEPILEAAHTHGLDPSLLRAVIHAESGFNPLAVSPKGAQGLMQLMPATASRFDVTDALNPALNIDGGARYLSWLLDRFNADLDLAIAAYNAGEGAVDRFGGVPPYKETLTYVERVSHLYRRYRDAAETPLAGQFASSGPNDGP